MRARVTAVAGAVAITPAIVACGTTADGDEASLTDEPVNGTTTTPVESADDAPPSVVALMDIAGCDGDLIEPQLYTREVGRCMLDDHELDVAAFDSNEQRDEWVAFAHDLGAAVLTGDRCAVSGFDAAGPEAFVDALN